MDQSPDILERARRDLAQGGQAAVERADSAQQAWLWAFFGLSVTLFGGVLLLPMGALAYRLQMVVHGVCAQAHYLTIGPYRMPLCARNTGIYAGFLATVLYLLILGRARAAKLPPLSIALVLLVAVGAMALDGFNSLALDLGGYNLYTPRNSLRVITGLGMGMAIATFMLLMLNLSLRYDARHEQRIIRNWVELIGGFVVAAGLYVLIFFAPASLYYPLAIFSVVGIIGVLFITNLFVIAMISGWEGRVRTLRQIAKPATLGIVLTAAELAFLTGLREWVERSLGLG